MGVTWDTQHSAHRLQQSASGSTQFAACNTGHRTLNSTWHTSCKHSTWAACRTGCNTEHSGICNTQLSTEHSAACSQYTGWNRGHSALSTWQHAVHTGHSAHRAATQGTQHLAACSKQGTGCNMGRGTQHSAHRLHNSTQPTPHSTMQCPHGTRCNRPRLQHGARSSTQLRTLRKKTAMTCEKKTTRTWRKKRLVVE